MEYLFITIVGSVFVYGFRHWFKLVNTDEYIKHIKWTIVAFVIIMTGIFFMNPNKISLIVNNIFSTIHPLWVFGIIAIFFPASIYTLLLGKYRTITDVFQDKNWFFPFIIIIIGMSLILFKVPYYEIIIFVFLMPTIGFLHGLFGPLIASFNISLFLTYFFKQKALNIDINTVFDFFSFINITDPSMKWGILLISTFFGLSTIIENIINIKKNYIYY